MNPASLDRQVFIVSPSGAVNPEYVSGAKGVLSGWGYRVTVAPHACESFGRFASPDKDRLNDLQDAINAPGTGIILCARGGYGLNRIIDKVDFTPLLDPKRFKLIVGFSDITVIHNAVSRMGLCSLHAAMAKNICCEPESIAVGTLRGVLSGRPIDYRLFSEKQNRAGMAEGKLVGGNLSLIYSLRGTKFDLNYDGAILFIEDVGENLYHIDRMMQNLRSGGVFERISGMVVGQFTDCNADKSFHSAESIVADAVKDYDFPVAYGFSAGHIGDLNLPLLLGVNYKLNVSKTSKYVTLSQTAD